MWVDVLINPKQGKVFREFIGELINLELDYDDEVESKNMSDRIEGVLSEEANELNTVQKILSYRKGVQAGSGQKTSLSTYSPHDCVEEPQKTTTMKENNNWYHGKGNSISWPISGTKKIVPQRRC